MQNLIVFSDLDHLASMAADRVVEIGSSAIDSRGVFTWVLSGGATPLPVYRRFRQQNHILDWSRVHIFWGDERCLPPNDPQSNYYQAEEALLAHVPIPAKNIHRIKGKLPARRGAQDYQAHLAEFFAEHTTLGWQDLGDSRFPSFDLILLGMGDDGHTASLFPGSPALEEMARWVVGVPHNQPPPPLVDRVSFTLPLINSAVHVIFLVSGESKALRLQQVFSEDAEPRLPARRVRPISGRMEWLVDRAAASSMPGFNN